MSAFEASPTTTRLVIPALRSEAVFRAGVIREMDAAARRSPLVVVRAPAGYGKTTAIMQWLEAAGVTHAWLSLDERDNDPRRFAAHLLTGLAPLVTGRLEPAMRALLAGSDLRDTVVPLVADALGTRPPGRLALVLDDYHAISEPACHELTTAVIDRLPAAARVVIGSRTPPPLRLPRRRAAGLVGEIGSERLRFERDEAEALLNGSLDLRLEPGEIRLIDEHVQGWPVGLALIASALAGQRQRSRLLDALARSRDDLKAYLIEEVLDAARPELRDFLCRTSILRDLTPELCEAMLDDPRARRLLEEVRHTNLFVTVVDVEAGSARYHPTFAETLAEDLRRREPGLVIELHRRASAWLEGAGMPEAAIEHALAAGDGPRAAGLLAGSWPVLMAERRHATLRRILDRLPSERGAFGPLCEVLDVFCQVLEGVDQRITAERAEALAREHAGAPGVGLLLDVLRTSPFYGDVRRAVEVGRDGWQRYEHDPAGRLQLVGLFSLALWFAGDYDEVRRLLEPRIGLDEPPVRAVWTLSVLALTAADEGDAETAERYAREAMALVEQLGGQTATEFIGVHWTLGEALRVAGNLGEAREHLVRALDLEARRPGSVGHALALTFDARLAVCERDWDRAAERAAAARRIIDRFPDVGTLETRLAGVEAALRDARADPLLGTRPTRAELRVLALLDGDGTIADIAAELYLSRNTVKSHVRRLYRRLGENTREGTVAAARERGLLGDPAVGTRATAQPR